MQEILILLFIVILIFYSKNNIKENFLERNIIDIKYIEKLNMKDKICRKLIVNNKLADKEKILDIYYKHIRKLDVNEHKKIINLFSIIDNTLKKNKKYKKWLEIYFKVYIFDNIENNYPHTHHNNILIPVDFELKDIYSIKNTLLHEKMHIIQRFKRDSFYNLYENYWNFRYKQISNLNKIERYSRTNPDGIDNNWVFCRDGIKIVLLSLYKSGSKKLGDVETYGIYLDDDYRIQMPLKKKRIGEIDEFTLFFGELNNNNYHPNEISADMLASYLLDDDNNFDNRSQAYKMLDKWWKNIN